MKVLLKIIFTFFSIIILASSGMPADAVEQKATDRKSETANVFEYPDYDSLKGAELIRMVQLVLEDEGFDPGPIDGILGPKTREAIKKFQMEKELEPTGEIDEQTFDRLFWRF